jgi:hypothetical protein
MGRRKKNGEKKEKRSPVKLAAIPRKHAGKVTEPWAILESLIVSMTKANPVRFGHLENCRLKLWWTKDWKADPDGIVVGAQVCKANEVDRILVEENNGESPDIFIKLPQTQWPHLDDTEKEHRLFHELCHVRPALDANGNQKRDTKERLLWRLGRHPITCFPKEIDRFGAERVIGHNALIAASVEVAARPLLKKFDEAEATDAAKPDGWKRLAISRLDLPPPVEQYIMDAGIKTIGQLSKHQADHGEFWDKDITVGGTRKPANFRAKIEDAFAEFWATHPEYAGS